MLKTKRTRFTFQALIRTQCILMPALTTYRMVVITEAIYNHSHRHLQQMSADMEL